MKSPAAGHHEVQVHVGVLVFAVIQVEQFRAVEQADADRRDAAAQDRGRRRQRSSGGGWRLRRSRQGVDQGDEGAVDGRGARAAVGFEHVAVDPQGALAELRQVDDGPQTAADEPLDFDAAAVDLAAAVARLARVGAAGQHAVLGGEPALAGADEERRHGRLDAAGAEDGGAAHAHQDAAGRLAGVATLKRQGTKLIGTTVVGAHRDYLARRW